MVNIHLFHWKCINWQILVSAADHDAGEAGEEEDKENKAEAVEVRVNDLDAFLQKNCIFVCSCIHVYLNPINDGFSNCSWTAGPRATNWFLWDVSACGTVTHIDYCSLKQRTNPLILNKCQKLCEKCFSDRFATIWFQEKAAEEVRPDSSASVGGKGDSKLTNQFNFSERASQTYNNPYRVSTNYFMLKKQS